MAIATVLFYSCKENTTNNKLISITVSSSGGQMGYNSSQKITADSLIYFFNINLDTIEAINGRKKNPNVELEKIIANNQIDSFSLIKNGELTALYDGIDTEITIETTEKKFVVVNGQNDPLWQRIKLAIDSIFKKEFNIK
jgi:hypothetical protein